MKSCTNCKHFVPAWVGNEASMSQPAFCLKKKIILTKDIESKGCEKHGD